MASPNKTVRSRVSQEKENRQNRLDDEEWLWREETKKPVLKSRGLDPKAFHRSSGSDDVSQRRGLAAVRELHSQTQQSLLKQEKRKVCEHAELQRSAYKQVTSLRTLPLQSQALARFRELIKEYMHDDGDDDDDNKEELSDISRNSITNDNEQNHDTASDDLSPAFSSSAASSSGRSADHEPKRTLRNVGKSPAQSRRKAEYRQQFLQEQALSKPLPVGHPFAHPFASHLWSMEPRVFAFEKSGAGKRKYVVGHMGRFLDKYWRKTDPHHRYYYELIPEKTPCRLYLDLEFSKESNTISAKEAEGLLQELLDEINLELSDKFGLDRLKRSSIVDLDSSTAKKFSRHWIIRLPKETLFPHTAAMGYFMQELVSRLSNEQATGQLTEKNRPMLHKYLFVQVSPSNVDSGKQTCFVDLGVYTRNRLFRLLGSSKFGKPPSAALRIAETNEFPFPKGFTNASFYLPAVQDRLRKNRSDGSNGDDFVSGEDSDDLKAAIKHFKAATDWGGHARALVDALVVPMDVKKISYPILPFDDSLLEKAAKPGVLCGQNQRKTVTSSSLSYGQSPYPQLDRFVLETLGTRGGIRGTIRAWSIEYGTDGAPLWITYQMLRNRWCESIQRHHKSNNITWTVDMQLWHCVQSCHDPECRALQFRGTPVRLPEVVREQVQDAIFEEQLARLDEADLLAQHVDQNTQQESTASSSGTSCCSVVDTGVEKAFATLSLDENSPMAPSTETFVGDTPKCIVVTQDTARSNTQQHQLIDDPDDSEDEVDLVEFMQRNAGAKRETGRKDTVNNNNNNNQDVQEEPEIKKGISESRESLLSDDDLLDAILSNPELFP